MKKKFKDGLAYSTDPDKVDDLQIKVGKPTLAVFEQVLSVREETNKKNSKMITIVSGFVGSEADLKALARTLKNKFAVGGSLKKNDLILQGSLKKRVVDFLLENNYRIT